MLSLEFIHKPYSGYCPEYDKVHGVTLTYVKEYADEQTPPTAKKVQGDCADRDKCQYFAEHGYCPVDASAPPTP